MKNRILALHKKPGMMILYGLNSNYDCLSYCHYISDKPTDKTFQIAGYYICS